MKKNLQIALAFWFVFTSIVLAQLIAVYLRNGVGGLITCSFKTGPFPTLL